MTRATETLIDFTEPAEASRWRAVDDVVMGGRSSSRVEPTAEGAAFTGNVSLENNGGFASVRTEGDRCSLAGAKAVVLRVRGDGRIYRMRFRTGTEYDVPSYQATFETRAGEWMDVELDVADFELEWRGRRVAERRHMNLGAVRSFGLVIGDKQEGPFRLELSSIGKR